MARDVQMPWPCAPTQYNNSSQLAGRLGPPNSQDLQKKVSKEEHTSGDMLTIVDYKHIVPACYHPKDASLAYQVEDLRRVALSKS